MTTHTRIIDRATMVRLKNENAELKAENAELKKEIDSVRHEFFGFIEVVGGSKNIREAIKALKAENAELKNYKKGAEIIDGERILNIVKLEAENAILNEAVDLAKFELGIVQSKRRLEVPQLQAFAEENVKLREQVIRGMGTNIEDTWDIVALSELKEEIAKLKETQAKLVGDIVGVFNVGEACNSQTSGLNKIFIMSHSTWRRDYEEKEVLKRSRGKLAEFFAKPPHSTKESLIKWSEETE